MANKITLKNSVKIINNDYVIKKQNNNLDNIYNYLQSRSFDYFPKIIKENNNNIYYEYISDINEPKEQKIIDLIILISILHSKTTFYKEVDIDYYKELYEKISNEIDDTYNYYNEVMDNIESIIYMSPSNYLIARNISMIYKNLSYAKNMIDKWYKQVENERKVRVVLIHNNLKLEHYLKADKSYLISWDNSKIDMPIFDLVSLYKNNYLDFEFVDLLNIYLKKYPLTSEEMYLFLAIIAIPSKIIKEDSEYKTVTSIRRIIDYVYKTNKILEKYRIENKTNQDNKLQKQN